eukprot:3791677-Amphidinium_carterae.1
MTQRVWNLIVDQSLSAEEQSTLGWRARGTSLEPLRWEVRRLLLSIGYTETRTTPLHRILAQLRKKQWPIWFTRLGIDLHQHYKESALAAASAGRASADSERFASVTTLGVLVVLCASSCERRDLEGREKSCRTLSTLVTKCTNAGTDGSADIHLDDKSLCWSGLEKTHCQHVNAPIATNFLQLTTRGDRFARCCRELFARSDCPACKAWLTRLIIAAAIEIDSLREAWAPEEGQSLAVLRTLSGKRRKLDEVEQQTVLATSKGQDAAKLAYASSDMCSMLSVATAR